MTTQGRGSAPNGDLSQDQSRTRRTQLESVTRAPIELPDWIAPPVRRGRPPERLANLAQLALAIRCPICHAHRGRWCSGAAYERPRRRLGRELLHVARIDTAALSSERRRAERAEITATMLQAARTSTNPTEGMTP